MQHQFPSSFSNIPLINLREEFKATRELIESQEAEGWFARGRSVDAINTPLFVWLGMPEDLIGLLLQRSILGVEAYLPAALSLTAAALGVISPELVEKLRAPALFGARLHVENVYHRMPASVHPELSLRHLDQKLYQRTLLFYKGVRNPLFHGKQLQDPKLVEVRGAFAQIGDLYRWIDEWHDPRKRFKSSIQFGNLTIKLPITFTGDAS